jgi:hypothetical protein
VAQPPPAVALYVAQPPSAVLVRRWRGLAMLAAIVGLFAGGCGPMTVAGPGGAVVVEKIELYADPVALNWDDKPGPDGIRVQAIFYQVTPGQGDAPAAVKAVAVAGDIEFRLYEGRLHAADLNKAVPFQVWNYNQQQSRGYLCRTLVGEVYRLALEWGTHVPKTAYVTIVVGYRAGGNASMSFSAPVTVSMGIKSAQPASQP